MLTVLVNLELVSGGEGDLSSFGDFFVDDLLEDDLVTFKGFTDGFGEDFDGFDELLEAERLLLRVRTICVR